MAAITPLKSGVWSDTTVWSSGTIPTTGDTVTINGGFTVTIDQNVTVGSDPGAGLTPAIDIINGVLTFDTTASRTLTLRGDLRMQHGSSSASQLLIGSAASRVPASTIITIKFNDSAALSPGKYGFYHGSAYNNNASTSYSTSSKFQCYGAVKTGATTLTGAHSAAATTINVADTTGWQVGDEIVIATNTSSGSQTERRTIATVASSTQATITVGLTNAHGDQNRVCNISRNIVLTVSSAANASWMNGRYQTTGNWVWSYTQVDHMGAAFSNGSTGDTGNATGVIVCSNFAQDSVLTFDNCAMKDCIGSGLRLFQNTAATPSTISNSVFYNNIIGVNLQSSAIGNTVTGCYFLNQAANTAIGLNFSSGGIGNTLSNNEYIGCTNGWAMGAGYGNTETGSKFYACTQAFITNSGMSAGTTWTSCTLGVGPAGNQTNSQDINIGSKHVLLALFDNCTFNSATTLLNSANLITGSQVSLSRIGGVTTANKTYYAYAVLSQATDQLYSGTSYSLKVQPQSTTQSQTFSFNVMANASQPVAVVGYMYIDSNYGASNLPTVVLSGSGVSTGSLTWTAANSPSGWQQFAVYGTPSSNGLCTVTFTVQAGSTANVWIGNIAVAGVATNTGAFGYWFNGSPVSLLVSTGLGAFDIWSVPSSSLTAAGSAGLKLTQGATKGDLAAFID